MNRLLLLAIILLPIQQILAHEGHDDPPPKVKAREHYKPTAMPDRIVLSWTGDPAHTQDVGWRTSSDVKHAFVEYAVATRGPYFKENAIRTDASTKVFETDLGSYHLHHCKMRALAPATKYAYRVGDGNNWSEWFHFRTASDKPEPFSFIYFGDAQNDIRSMWSRIIREAYSDAPKASLMLHAGDLVNYANSDAEWGEWFGGGGWLNAMLPSIATPGNHEYFTDKDEKKRKEEAEKKARREARSDKRDDDGSDEEDKDDDGDKRESDSNAKDDDANDDDAEKDDKSGDGKKEEGKRDKDDSKDDSKDDETPKLSRHWQAVFALPNNGPKDLKESVYWLDYQGVRFISLNSNEKQDLQTEWLKKVLENNPNRWTIVTFHHPMYSSAKGRDNVEIRRIWKPILDKYKVDLVLQGHDHTYARSGKGLPINFENLETGVNIKEGPTVYVVSVSGPKQYDIGEREFFERTAGGAQLYQIIHIDHDELRFEARVANGELYDAFLLKKRKGQFNELINEIPKTPESRKPTVVDDGSSKEKKKPANQGGRFDPESIFATRDKNKDGELSGAEITPRMKRWLGNADKDKDGAISLEELKKAMSGRARGRGRARGNNNQRNRE